jgi:hypothetical protein
MRGNDQYIYLQMDKNWLNRQRKERKRMCEEQVKKIV